MKFAIHKIVSKNAQSNIVDTTKKWSKPIQIFKQFIFHQQFINSMHSDNPGNQQTTLFQLTPKAKHLNAQPTQFQQNQQPNFTHKLLENTSTTEQNFQLKDSFFQGYSISKSSQQDQQKQTKLKQFELQESLQEFQKANIAKLSKQDLYFDALQSPLTQLIWKISCKGLFRSQFIQSIQRDFLKRVTKNFLSNQLNNSFEISVLLSELMNIPYLRQLNRHFFAINQLQSQENQDYQNLQQTVQNRSFLKENNASCASSEQQNSQKTPECTKKKVSKQILCEKSHRICSDFLNVSMRRLKIEKIIKTLCKQIGAWTSGHSTGSSYESFLKKLVAIKTFFPQYFYEISKQFSKVTQEFKLKSILKKVEKYTIKNLIGRYQDCINIYARSDDILEVAEKLFKKSHQSNFGAKIKLFQNYQLQMKHKAQKYQAQKQVSILKFVNTSQKK